MSDKGFGGEEVRTESSWAGPARILFITLILAGGFAYYYFGPSVQDIQGNNPRASTSDEPIDISIAGERFVIPENYTQFGRARRGGEQDEVQLYAVLPSMDGYSLAYQDIFERNDDASPIVHFSIVDPKAADTRLGGRSLEEQISERERLERIYLPYTENPDGESWRYGFIRYRLSEQWGFKNEDLFVHEDADGSLYLFRCIEPEDNMPSPWCRRDTAFNDKVSVSYRFKRTRLSDWREIDRGIFDLVKRFHRPAAAPAEAKGS